MNGRDFPACVEAMLRDMAAGVRHCPPGLTVERVADQDGETRYWLRKDPLTRADAILPPLRDAAAALEEAVTLLESMPQVGEEMPDATQRVLGRLGDAGIAGHHVVVRTRWVADPCTGMVRTTVSMAGGAPLPEKLGARITRILADLPRAFDPHAVDGRVVVHWIASYPGQ